MDDDAFTRAQARTENVECQTCHGEGFLAAPCADGETRRFECFDCDGTGVEGPATWPDHEHCAHWRVFGDCCYCHSEQCAISTPENGRG